ncbi:hypothetical protein [Limosilactobacillus fastidiosus]|uniref:hypothetical protein n=1 Tax=Limosilactobacillus fastidiosus TaxID=2759855 RepID=UPI001E589A43|nr:hypothetical protein [Limosilactobacillus fastidiosus]MCD7085203.1 hypothetical protein [Limosilactobacillus fastidiosus]
MSTNHGGRRNGAGRKSKYGQQTKVIRLPIDLARELEFLTPENINNLTEQLYKRRRTLLTMEHGKYPK